MGNFASYVGSKSYVDAQMAKLPVQPIIPRSQIKNILYLHFMRENILINYDMLKDEYPFLQTREEWLEDHPSGCLTCCL